MSTAQMSNYDDFALIYARHWGPRYAAAAWDTLGALVLSHIPAGSRILDLCCGAGQAARVIAEHGFDVTGIDASAALISLARFNAPNASFLVADARQFALSKVFHAVISLNDSLNHLLRMEDLQAALKSAFECLLPGGVLLFDLNLAHKYETSWSGSIAIVDEDAVCAGCADADISQRIAKFNAAILTKQSDSWVRRDISLLQSWYAPEDVLATVGARITELIGEVMGYRGGPLAGAYERAGRFLRGWWGEPPAPPFAPSAC